MSQLATGRLRHLALTLAGALCLLMATLEDTPAQPVTTKHLGVASCASSQCHGKLEAQTDRDVALNEYRIWHSQDRHAQAYRTLSQQALSATIAAKLGLANAAASPVCLNCHADNVPPQSRGPKFQINDGVGCEACHGGSERWLDKHSQQGVTHAANVAAGMYPTDLPDRRAQLCLSCHQGAADKFVTHALVAAGHPRLRFELDTFTANQPAHFQVTASYVSRKGKPDETALWLTGQAESARRFLALLQSPVAAPPGMFPELAMYDCFACHHSTDKIRWTADRVGPGVHVGTPRLQREQLVILEAAASALGDTASAGYLRGAETALTRAGQSDEKSVRANAAEISAWLPSHGPWSRRSFSRADSSALRRTLVHYAASDRGSDYLVAEQMVLAIESLSYSLQDRDAHLSDLDTLYKSLGNPPTFDPAVFAHAAASVEKRF